MRVRYEFVDEMPCGVPAIRDETDEQITYYLRSDLSGELVCLILDRMAVLETPEEASSWADVASRGKAASIGAQMAAG